MKTKRRLVFSAMFTLVAVLLTGLLLNVGRTEFFGIPKLLPQHKEPMKNSEKAHVQQNGTCQKKQVHVPSQAERRRMSPAARIELLEKLGFVPDDPDLSDYFLAENTTWWGKPLDPEKFWEGRVLWYDDFAEFEARRRGRGWPPMPYDDPSVADRPNIDRQNEGYGALDSPSPRFVSSERESVFWDKFMKTHPHPPGQIQRWIESSADSWLRLNAKIDDNIRTGCSSAEKDLASIMKRDLRDAKSFFLPFECVTPEAYQWDHVMRKRTEYEALVSSGKAEEPSEIERFFSRVSVDHAFITEPLTQDQIDAANAWKVAYLNRLRSEQWDDSYINAYLQAWNLSEEYVFGSSPE